ncbi:SEL1-like repeat protein [Chelatococcus reniformis]|uniref:Sel1 repeat family protein n=1 Tax=Chelatococcus reniformis TaxID=1494448 RepID=A0A916UQX2_9HYPH|nr:SEL1-like repeat protein [Chelatococcus reniformis]GGC83491.1 hypothetical protein GCM10010994_46700 [Chelatococcus reniformis]
MRTFDPPISSAPDGHAGPGNARAGSDDRPGSERERAPLPLDRIAARLQAYSDGSSTADLRRSSPPRAKISTARHGGAATSGRSDIFEPRVAAAAAGKTGLDRPRPEVAAQSADGSPASHGLGLDNLATRQDLRALHDAIDRAGQAMARQTRREVEEAMATPVRLLRDEVQGLAKTVGRAPGARVVLSLERRLDEIRTSIDALVRDGDAQNAEAQRLEGRLDQIDARLGGLVHTVEALAPAAGADTLTALRAEIVRLTEQLETQEVKGTDLSPLLSAVEKDLGEMRTHLNIVRDLAAKGGEAAPPAGPTHPPEVGDIRRSLAEIRAAQSHGSRQSEQGFEAMRRSLAELTQRLRTMEQPGARPAGGDEPRGARADARVLVGPVAPPPAPPTPRVAPPRAADARSSSITAPPAVAPPTPPAADGLATEPAAAAGQLPRAGGHGTADEAPEEPLPPLPTAGGLVAAPGTIKANFINAARRARGLIGDPAPAADAAAPAPPGAAASEPTAETAQPSGRAEDAPGVEAPLRQPPVDQSSQTAIASVQPPSAADAALPRAGTPGVKPRSSLPRPKRPWLGKRGLFWVSGLAIAAVSAPAAVSVVRQLSIGSPQAPAPGHATARAPKTAEPGARARVADRSPAMAPPAAPSTPAPVMPDSPLSESPDAIYDLGDRLVEGGGGVKDLKLAATILEKAAERGLAPAQYRLGRLLEKGLGVPRDPARARLWYERAAVQGNVKAMHNLAVLCADGTEGKPDYAAAAVWFRRAAELGLSDSQFNLAVLLTRGLGITADAAEAYVWFAVAARGGDGEAARKRDEVGAGLSAVGLESARAVADRWKAQPLDRAANEAVPGTDTSAPAAVAPAPPNASNRVPARNGRA